MIDRPTWVGVFIAATALPVIAVTLVQMRYEGEGLRETLGQILFALGLLAVGLGYLFAAPATERWVVLSGVALIVGGVFWQERIAGPGAV